MVYFLMREVLPYDATLAPHSLGKESKRRAKFLSI
jgi:hypothetical protein